MKLLIIAVAVLIQTATCQVGQNSNQNVQPGDMSSSGTMHHLQMFNQQLRNQNYQKQSGPPSRGTHYSKPPHNPHDRQNLQPYTTYAAGPLKYQGTQTQIMPVQPAIEHPFAPSNAIGDDPSKPISFSYGSSGPGFMRLLLGSMGIHLGGGRPGRRPLAKLPGPRPLVSPFTTVNQVGPYPHGPSNPVHLSNHLQAVQGIAQMQHVQVSHEQQGESGKPVEYSSGGSSGIPVTVQHYYHPSQLQPQLLGFPINNYAAGPEIAQYPSPYVSYSNSLYPSNPPVVTGTSIESPNAYTQSDKSVKYEEPQVGKVENTESGSGSRKPKSVSDSTYESSEPSRQYDDVLLDSRENSDIQLQPYTIIERPVVHYVEKPVVRFVEKTVVRTIEKPVVKIVEKPVIKYVRGPPPNGINSNDGQTYVSGESPKIIKSIEPQITTNVQQQQQQHDYSQNHLSNHQQPQSHTSHDNSHEFYSSYGGAYFRKNPQPAQKVLGAKEVHGDNAFKSPLINIPQELPAYSPSSDYKVIKTHIYGPTISGEGLNLPPFGQSHQGKDINEQASTPKNIHHGSDGFLL